MYRKRSASIFVFHGLKIGGTGRDPLFIHGLKIGGISHEFNHRLIMGGFDSELFMG